MGDSMELNLKDAHRKLYFFMKRDIDLIQFEQWLYSHDELEELLEKHYLDLISTNFNSKFAREELEKIIGKIIHPGEFEAERLQILLQKLVEFDEKNFEIMETIYNEYCKGYSFLRYIALTYITTADPYQEELKVNIAKLMEYRKPIIMEARRILGFMERHEIKITKEYEYEDIRKEIDRIELNRIESMYKDM
ncbi:hypothetical protein [Gorillibacterium sp. sgz5001074]|uniref:hypothetical protein n=1 Tax=Gorillibacterium sp. sgz5001074 TaxID=3446695 RepID=UPI003F681072